MRFKLPENYDFTYFSDRESMGFKVNSTPDGSFVMPEFPFSITDKMETLKNKGFTHLLIDFSKTKVSKSELRTMIGILQSKQVIPDSSRFNWKDGFYDPEKIEAYQAAQARAKETLQPGAKRKPRRK